MAFPVPKLKPPLTLLGAVVVEPDAGAPKEKTGAGAPPKVNVVGAPNEMPAGASFLGSVAGAGEAFSATEGLAGLAAGCFTGLSAGADFASCACDSVAPVAVGALGLAGVTAGGCTTEPENENVAGPAIGKEMLPAANEASGAGAGMATLAVDAAGAVSVGFAGD